MEKKFLILTDLKRRGNDTSCTATQEAPGLVRRPREGRSVGKSLYCDFLGKEQVRQGKQVWIGEFE